MTGFYTGPSNLKSCGNGFENALCSHVQFDVVRTVSAEMKREALLDVLGQEEGRGVVFVQSAKIADELRGFLLSQRILAGRAYQKMRAKDRQRIQEQFIAGKFRILLVTGNLDMQGFRGKMNYAIHYDSPISLDQYWAQLESVILPPVKLRAILFFQREDRKIQELFSFGRCPSIEDMEKVYLSLKAEADRFAFPRLNVEEIAELTELSEQRVRNAILRLEGAGILHRSRKYFALPLYGEWEVLKRALEDFEARFSSVRQRLEKMVRYGQSLECRLRFLAEYFGKSEAPYCGRCDNCRRLRQRERGFESSLDVA